MCLDQSDLVGNPSKVAAAVQGIWNFKAAAALDALLRGLPRERTIVHVHGWAKALSPAIAGPIARSGLPALYTMHEYFQFCPNGGFYNYQERHICTLKPMGAACWATNCDSRNYARKLWRNVRQLAAQHIAHLPEIFSDYIAISDLQESVAAPLLPRGVTLHRVSNPVAVPDLGPKSNPASGKSSSSAACRRKKACSFSPRPRGRSASCRPSSATDRWRPSSPRAIRRRGCSAGTTPPACTRPCEPPAR